MTGVKALVIQGMEETEVANAFCASAFASKTALRKQFLETMVKSEARKRLPLVEQAWIREYLQKVDVHKCVGPDGMCPGAGWCH